ncbi:MAG: hypothetical protein HDKAJFGB_01194 [Anaerolineae bacterium]|nr:hypothetical protein [Anaerolineae bacterium]
MQNVIFRLTELRAQSVERRRREPRQANFILRDQLCERVLQTRPFALDIERVAVLGTRQHRQQIYGRGRGKRFHAFGQFKIPHNRRLFAQRQIIAPRRVVQIFPRQIRQFGNIVQAQAHAQTFGLAFRFVSTAAIGHQRFIVKRRVKQSRAHLFNPLLRRKRRAGGRFAARHAREKSF